ncbi:MAG: CoA-binding protein [Nitrospinae bacterium]|nr:CoA-binding protein [Nitrospinota bacterium]
MPESCDISKRPPGPEGNPPADVIAGILKSAKTIAVVGLSDKPGRASNDVAAYLMDHGYTIIPVNPALNERGWKGIKAYAKLPEIPGEVDIVDFFMRAELIGGLVDEVIAKGPKVAWLQLGIVNNEAARRLRAAGMTVVQDKCVKIEHRALATDSY